MTDTLLDVDRRAFLKLGGGAVATSALLSGCGSATPAVAAPAPKASGDKWDQVRSNFDLDPDYMHFSGFLLTPHPLPVRKEIEKYRRLLDIYRTKRAEARAVTADPIESGDFLWLFRRK